VRTGIDYENNGEPGTIAWDADGMRLLQRTGGGAWEVICNIANGMSDIAERSSTSSELKFLIREYRLLANVCGFFGIKPNETVKAERKSDGTMEITPNSGIHKGEKFTITADTPPIFKRASGEQLVQVAPEVMNHHLFKKYFCWGIERGGKTYYEFFERAGGQKVAYCAVRDGGNIKFYAGGLANPVDPNKEISFIDIGEVPGLAHLAQDGSKLDGIYHKKDGIIELTTLQHHGEPVRLKKAGDKWVLASNPNMELISQQKFASLLQNEGSGGLGGTPIRGVESPMGSWTKYLVFNENTSNLSAKNFLFLIPEEDQDKDKAKTFFKEEHKAKDANPGTFGLFGQSEPSKLSLDADTLTVRSHFLRWSQGNVGRYGEFTIQESDSKAITRTALALIARAMREKNYTQALGFFNAIPNGIMLGKGDEDDAIRRMFFDIIMDDFDATPTAAAMHMQLLLKWLQIDTTVSSSISELAQNKGRTEREAFVQKFVDTVNGKFVKAWREKAFYPQIFALTHLQKTALLEKLKGVYSGVTP
jgi:hypothetical protein